MRINLVLYFCLLTSLLYKQTAHATHLRAGEITVQRLSCSSLTFRITLTIYIDTQSGVEVGGREDWLEFGDGKKMLVPTQKTILRPDLGEDMGIVVFKIDYTYSAPSSQYTIRFTGVNRNEHVVNMDRSIDTPFYLETTLYLDPFLDCNQNLPELLIPPIDKACKGATFFHNPGAFDPDGDSLSFEMSIPKRGYATPVDNYKEPSDAKFYHNYTAGNEDKNDIPTFSIDPRDGTMKWDAPGSVGEYNVAFHIIEWRKDAGGKWQKISYITRDMQIRVDDCNNTRPDLIIPSDTCVVAGTVIDKTIFGVDADNDDVKIEVFSEVLHLGNSPAIYSPNPPAFRSSTPNAKFYFIWKTTCDYVKEQYYQVVFKITDNPPNGTKLVTFKTWRIKIIGPPPEWSTVQIDVARRKATLAWDSYPCANASKMQVWRRIDGTNYVPERCDTGLPDYLGYTLISTVELEDETAEFTDTNNSTGLAPGATYCYRLVALFPNPKGGESYVSRDTCLTVPINAPVITHVTVEKTQTEEGAVRISWNSPFEINKADFPGPYLYEVYRGRGFDGEATVRITPVNGINDTTFVDALINTKGEVFNYKVVLYSNTATAPSQWIAIDTSSVASSVRLKALENDGAIALSWQAQVPWSNTSPEHPYHLIYRAEQGTPENSFALIDSVFVQQAGFAYIDNGTFQNTALDKDKVYCYRVVTRGAYGNAKMDEPFENYSQMACASPKTPALPCTPVLSLTSVDCDQLFAASNCVVKNFSNKLHWKTDCTADVAFYRVYVAARPEDEFVMIADNVNDTSFIDKNLPSFARCYKIAAVNAQGQEGGWSEMICNDNCPYFELPNIFTPNGDGCNEYFRAYGPFNPSNKNEFCLSGEFDNSKCLRFVNEVIFRVYNRWGNEIYTYVSGKGDSSTYINWDGKDNEGKSVTPGVYYYLAEVTFNTLDPSKKNQRIKGWVHVVW
jgi:hypothetical protein